MSHRLQSHDKMLQNLQYPLDFPGGAVELKVAGVEPTPVSSLAFPFMRFHSALTLSSSTYCLDQVSQSISVASYNHISVTI